jgi:hypothetical protein
MTSRGERLVRDLALLRCLGMDLQDNRALALLDIGMFTWFGAVARPRDE